MYISQDILLFHIIGQAACSYHWTWCPLTGAHETSAFYTLIMTTLKVQTTLTKTFQNGTVSKWVFGQLSSGGFGAKSFGTKHPYKKVFGSLKELDIEIERLKGYGFTKPSTSLIQQLSLAV